MTIITVRFARTIGALTDGQVSRCLAPASQFPLENLFLVQLFRRQICTSRVLDKRQSPLTVGVPAWKKAAIARKSLVTKLRQPKSMETIQAEMKLENNPVGLNIYTTTRIKALPEDKVPMKRLKPEVFMSKDDNTIICYHPAVSYPRDKTRESWEWPKWYGSIYDIAEYSDTMTNEQNLVECKLFFWYALESVMQAADIQCAIEESEAKSLIENDPRLWNFASLGHMLKVKPAVISKMFPLNEQQISEIQLEHKMLREWGKVRRTDYKKYQNQERIEYVRKTRGEDAVKHFKSKMKI